MTNTNNRKTILLSGGGTGGHIYPAIATAMALQKLDPNLDIHFVGALGRMEMDIVPKYGYSITGLPIAGINRKSLLKNISLPFKILRSLKQVRTLLKQYQPIAVAGFGGYASGPLLRAAQSAGIPTLLQEQNSYAGVTNKILARKAKTICVAYPNMQEHFPAEKIVYTGNPLRWLPDHTPLDIAASKESFGVPSDWPTILILGGSLGAGAINNWVIENAPVLANKPVGVIWQCGKYAFQNNGAQWTAQLPANIKVMPFIEQMQAAYAAADIIISRAGALTISELQVIGKPVILIPSPNVAEDHQTKNANALIQAKAALLVSDSHIQSDLLQTVTSLLDDLALQRLLGHNIRAMSKPQASLDVAQAILNLRSR